MPLFDTLAPKFFNPFASKNREIYFECITLLIEKSKEIATLYEQDARQCLILYLQNCQYAIQTEDIGEEVSGSLTSQENAARILRYFRNCGWITPREIGRSGDNIASVSAYCRKLVEAIRKIFDHDANGAITNHIFSIYEILKAALEKDSARAQRPYSSVLIPLVEHECDLKNELLILKDSIREIMRAVIKMSDANSFGQFLIKDELLQSFFNDYFFIKKSGLIPSYISNIDRMLTKLRHSEQVSKMVKEYQATRNVDEETARETVHRQLGELDSFINLEYDWEMAYIDKKINTYYNLYSTRIMMVLSNSTNLEHELNRLLMWLKDLDEEERTACLLRLAEAHRLQSIGMIGRKSLERRKRVNANRASAGMVAQELSEDEKKRLTEELLTETPDRYSVEKVKDYWEQIPIPDGGIAIEECGLRTREDAMMAAAGIVYSGAAGFPYQVEFCEGMVETDAALISKIRIKRAKNE